MNRNFIILTILFLFLTVFSVTVYGQPCPPDEFGNPTNCGDNDPSLPIDGGISLVILGAIGLGAKKIISGINKI